jgi:hypothetical protein
MTTSFPGRVQETRSVLRPQSQRRSLWEKRFVLFRLVTSDQGWYIEIISIFDFDFHFLIYFDFDFNSNFGKNFDLFQFRFSISISITSPARTYLRAPINGKTRILLTRKNLRELGVGLWLTFRVKCDLRSLKILSGRYSDCKVQLYSV